MSRERRYLPVVFLLAPLVLLGLFAYYPIVSMIRYSLTEWDGLGPKKFVGLSNYAEVARRPDLFGVFRVSLYYLVGSLVQLVLALYFATVLSFKTHFRNFFKGVLFFPYLVNGVAIGFIFLFFFRPGGTLDSTISAFGGNGSHPQWLGDRSLINVSLTGVSLWRYTGLNMVLFLGAIQSVDPDLYEASSLDGATRWQQFRWIIAPSIRPVIGLSSILAVQGSLSVFEIPYVMTAGANGSMTFVIQTVEMAFKYQKVGLASAMAVVLLAIILTISYVQRRLVPDESMDALA